MSRSCGTLRQIYVLNVSTGKIMKKRYYMGIDIGTSQSKGVVVDRQGRIAAFKAVDHDTVSIRQGFFEHDPEKVWFHDLVYLIRALLKEGGIRSEEVISVGISAIGPCVVMTDQEGKPLRDAILYGIDTRAEKEIQLLNQRYGQEYFISKCGNSLSSQSAGPKILWVRRNEPEVYCRTKMIMTAASYLVFRLTGRNVMDYYTACAGYTPLFSCEDMCWDVEMCRELGCAGMLPELMWSDMPAGTVTRKAAELTGLSEGTVVNAGTSDAAAEAVSVGAAEPGKTFLMMGSTAFIIKVMDRMERDVRMWSAPFVFPGTYSLSGGMSASGSLTKWFLEEMAPDVQKEARQEGVNAYERLSKMAEKIPPGCGGLLALPYFCGERTPIFDSSAKGVFFGLNLNHTRMHLYRALLEGVGSGIRDNLNVLDCYGDLYDEIVTAGGGCRNRLWLQIISDITGKSQALKEITVGAAYGDAFLGGLASGEIDREEIEEWNREEARIIPDESARTIYDRWYDIYKGIYISTKEYMEELDRITKDEKEENL